MQGFISQFAGFLWSMLCHSLWTIPVIGLIFRFRIESLSSTQIDRNLRRSVIAFLFVPGLIALSFLAFERKSTGSERSGDAIPSGTSTLEKSLPASERSMPDGYARTQSKSPSILISLRSAIRNAAPWAIFFWSAGMIVLSIRLCLGGLILQYRIGSSWPHTELQSLADSLAQRLELSRPPAVRVSKSVMQPMVSGISHPVVILPGDWLLSADPDYVEAVLAHELAHLERSDLRSHFLERLAEVVWFFHPAMHRWNRDAALWRELAADRLAVGLTGKPLALASALESFASKIHLIGSRSPFESFGLPLVASKPRGAVLTRVEAVLGTGEYRPMRIVRKSVGVIGALIILLAIFSLLMVQTKPFAMGSRFRTAMPIGGVAGLHLSEINESGPKIEYQITLVNVDSEFAGNLLKSTVNLPEGAFLPEHLVIGPELKESLISHPSSSSMLMPGIKGYDRSTLQGRWEAPNKIKIALIEQFGRTVPEKVRSEKVWTEFRFIGELTAGGIELRSEITDFNDRMKPAPSASSAAGIPNINRSPYLMSMTEAIELKDTRTLKPGESLCVRLGQSMEPYRKEPRFLYEQVLGEKGSRVAQFARLAIVTARVASVDVGTTDPNH